MVRIRCKKALVIFMPNKAIELFSGNEGRQILDYVTKQRYITREYFVDDVWKSEPKGKVRGFRYNLGDIKKEIEDIAKIWKYIKDRSLETPKRPDKVLELLALVKLKPEKLVLFSPWGPRYNSMDDYRISEQDPEIKTLKEIKEIFEQFKAKGYMLDFLLMPADVYGTEINSLKKKFVEDYFKDLECQVYNLLGKADITIKSWSEIREENKNKYKELSEKFNENLAEYIKERTFKKNIEVAKNFNPEKAGESARRYCIERLVEGEIINDKYNPIKLSLVRKEKDILDGLLKTIYIIENKAPWLGGK